jgi:small-conductance mechanosensitive channel
LEGQIKAHGATVTEIRDKINTVKTEAKADLDTVEKDFIEKISSCAGSLESAKTELTKKVDARVDALEEKIQGLKKGAEDLEEDIGKTLTQVKDGAERALGATKGALLEALEKHKAESLKALQTAKTELTKEREEAEGRTTAAREALGMAIRHRLSRVLHCAFVSYTYKADDCLESLAGARSGESMMRWKGLSSKAISPSSRQRRPTTMHRRLCVKPRLANWLPRSPLLLLCPLASCCIANDCVDVVDSKSVSLPRSVPLSPLLLARVCARSFR